MECRLSCVVDFVGEVVVLVGSRAESDHEFEGSYGGDCFDLLQPGL